MPTESGMVGQGSQPGRSTKKRCGVTNERKNITQPSDWWEAFEKQAKSEGMTLAAWLGEAAKLKLPAKVVKKLSERPPANRPKRKQQRSE